MIDMHGHYLPGVDDGAADMDASLAMLRHAEKDGIMTAVVTPHACSGLSTFKGFDALRRSWEKWLASLAGNAIAIRVVRGAEVFFTSELLSILKENGDLLTINKGSYFLLEFPEDFVYPHSKEFIFKILTEGYIPIISHPERNRGIQQSPAILHALVKAGALCQINAGSLRGDFGNDARQCAYELLRDNLVHVIASDAHNLSSRRPELSFIPALLRQVPQEKIQLYLHDIPEAIIADLAVPDIGEPNMSSAKRSFFDFFKKRDS